MLEDSNALGCRQRKCFFFVLKVKVCYHMVSTIYIYPLSVILKIIKYNLYNIQTMEISFTNLPNRMDAIQILKTEEAQTHYWMTLAVYIY